METLLWYSLNQHKTNGNPQYKNQVVILPLLSPLSEGTHLSLLSNNRTNTFSSKSNSRNNIMDPNSPHNTRRLILGMPNNRIRYLLWERSCMIVPCPGPHNSRWRSIKRGGSINSHHNSKVGSLDRRKIGKCHSRCLRNSSNKGIAKVYSNIKRITSQSRDKDPNTCKEVINSSHHHHSSSNLHKTSKTSSGYHSSRAIKAVHLRNRGRLCLRFNNKATLPQILEIPEILGTSGTPMAHQPLPLNSYLFTDSMVPSLLKTRHKPPPSISRGHRNLLAPQLCSSSSG